MTSSGHFIIPIYIYNVHKLFTLNISDYKKKTISIKYFGKTIGGPNYLLEILLVGT